MPTSFVLRHSSAGAPQFLAERSALECHQRRRRRARTSHAGVCSIPYTIRERKDGSKDFNVVIIGDILFSRVARSNIFAPDETWGARHPGRAEHAGSARVSKNWASPFRTISTKFCPTADVVNLLRIQHERQRKEYFPGVGEYIRLFGLTKERAKLLKPDCLIMHPGPINRGDRDRQRSSRRTAERHSRPGHQRSRRAHGCSCISAEGSQ